jgi:hypothetical protein
LITNSISSNSSFSSLSSSYSSSLLRKTKTKNSMKIENSKSDEESLSLQIIEFNDSQTNLIKQYFGSSQENEENNNTRNQRANTNQSPST